MRVAIIAPPWLPVPPTRYGGTEQVLDNLARGLTAAGHEVLLFATGDSSCPVRKDWLYDRALGIGMGDSLASVRHVVRAYESVQGYDLVHDHTLVGPLYSDVLADVPVVTTNHGPFGGEVAEHYRVVAVQASIVAISRHQASTAGDIPIAGVIHHGVDVRSFPVVREPVERYALFLGRMTAEKGIHTAIAVALTAGIPLRIAAKMSEPHEHAYFASRVEPLLGGQVEYLGEVTTEDKLDLLAGATCLLDPVEWPEPFGMVAVEALACGTPVVTTPCGALPELVDEGVTGFVRGDVTSLAAAVEQSASLDRTACRRAAETRFSVERMARDHVTLYERMLTRPGDRRRVLQQHA